MCDNKAINYTERRYSGGSGSLKYDVQSMFSQQCDLVLNSVNRYIKGHSSKDRKKMKKVLLYAVCP